MTGQNKSVSEASPITLAMLPRYSDSIAGVLPAIAGEWLRYADAFFLAGQAQLAGFDALVRHTDTLSDFEPHPNGEWVRYSDVEALVLAAAGVMQPVDERALDILGGAIKMVVNMLTRDDKPVRTEAAGALLAAFGTVAEQARAALSAGPTQAAPEVDDLAMLVRQLVHSLKKANPDSSLAKRSVDYLQRTGLAGNPLRAAEQTATTASESIDDDPEFQRLAEYWRGEPYGTRSFQNAWDEMVAYIDSRAQASSQDAPAAQAMRECPDCDGSGRISPAALCARCNESGVLPAAQAVERAAPDVRIGFEKWMHDNGEACHYAGDGMYEYSGTNKRAEAFRAGVEYALAAAPAAPAAPAVELSSQPVQPTLMRQAVASVVSRSGDNLRIGWLRPERCDVGTLLYCATEPAPAGTEPTQAARDVLADDAARYQWAKAQSPDLLCAIAYRYPAACDYDTPDEAIDAARGAK